MDRAALLALLATCHTGPDCPREPERQSAASAELAVWTRQLVMHVNYGRGRHGYVHAYTCLRCGAVERVGSESPAAAPVRAARPALPPAPPATPGVGAGVEPGASTSVVRVACERCDGDRFCRDCGGTGWVRHCSVCGDPLPPSGPCRGCIRLEREARALPTPESP